MTPDKASDNLTVQNFRKDCLRELKKIKLAWPELNYSTAPGVLILHPSTPAVAPPQSKPPTKLNHPFPGLSAARHGLGGPDQTLRCPQPPNR